MNLVIFPGGGNPDSALHAQVYALITLRASAFGYSTVDTSVRWPGHCSAGQTEQVLTFDGALSVAQTVLEKYEQSGEEYDILARSFGTYVALKSTMSKEFQTIRRIVLWGPPPFWNMWQIFVRDLVNTKDAALAKGLNIDARFFPSLEPIESLLLETERRVIVATGSEDKFATPPFHEYLTQMATRKRDNITFRPVVQGAPHEVTEKLPSEVVQDYLNSILG